MRQSTSNMSTTSIVCYNCNRPGHMSSQCRQRKINTNRTNRTNNNNQSSTRPRNSTGRGRRHPRRSTAATRGRANICEANVAEANLHHVSSAGSSRVNYEFVVDSGATDHMVSSPLWLSSLDRFAERREVKLGGARTLCIQGTGTANIQIDQNGSLSTLPLYGALLVQNLKRNLISVARLADEGYSIEVNSESILMRKDGLQVEAHRKGGLYVISARPQPEANFIKKIKDGVSLTSVHLAFAHINVETLKKMLSRDGITYVNDFKDCTHCIEGKMRRASYRPKPRSSISSRVGYIHSDTCQMRVKSFGGAQYFVSFTDDCSRFRKVYFLPSKDMVAEKL